MKKKKILLVDDEEILGKVYQEELQDEGYVVSYAGNGQEALQRFEGEPFDLVVLDIVMPGVDGIEALRRLKMKGKEVPVILHTAHPEYRLDPRTQLAEALVMKTTDLSELKRKVRELLDQKRFH